MSDVKEKKETVLEISKEVLDLSAKIGDSIFVSEHGTISQKEGVDCFMDNAPADIKDKIEAVQEYESLFATALLHNAGPKAIDHLKTHRDTKRVWGVIQTGKTGVAVNYTPPTGKKADGTMKDPSVTVAYRRKERDDHVAVRRMIESKTSELSD